MEFTGFDEIHYGVGHPTEVTEVGRQEAHFLNVIVGHELLPVIGCR